MKLAKEFTFKMGLNSTDKTIFTAKLDEEKHRITWGTEKKYEKIIPTMYRITWTNVDEEVRGIKYELEDVIDCIKTGSWVIVEIIKEDVNETDSVSK
jgi:hypothetical protein